ncbi:MAG: D-alanine--D-alanine ligase family protein [Bacteroidota bacterium]|jgi:D-alanine-D-alanine ligase|nr:ATP-grasp domain-containing protein [Ignavibacteria bacterium]MCU7498289.1 ATP-grasp domain-containing protein [Ignavibacteria bacterium]MCU7511219.1 ATP-grasp domain-containing protein [Ignavibacteria bacterium]MCU7519059.1 ATP-grasp domain-containing protein [Ignavibacteria bacterium]MCU7523340.1 ATP-grasp domain-containing protein [Ignavibacteria bacterium]
MSSEAKILVCYNEPAKVYKNYVGKNISSDDENVDMSETGMLEHINDIVSGLQLYFKNVDTFAFSSDVERAITSIVAYSPDVIFNFVESVEGKANYEAYTAGLYELLGYNYTGNVPLCLGLCLNKARTKQLLQSGGIKTPGFYIAKFNGVIDPESFGLKFPVILKLLNEDASIGISEFSVVNNIDEVNRRLGFLFKTYRQDVIIEEFINGREFNVSILGGDVLPISEIIFNGLPKGLPKIVTYEGKWSPNSTYYKYTNPNCPADIDDELKEKIETAAREAYELMNCRDYARIDIRLSKSGVPYVIEVNPNPDLSQDAGFARAARAKGLSYPELLYSIVSLALERKEHDTKTEA